MKKSTSDIKILLACERSATVRDAFAKRGFNAWSCDIEPSEKPGQHFQCDVREVLSQGWDAMIAFPPCTFITSSGLHWNARVPERQAKTEEALEFVQLLIDAPIDSIGLENPIGAISSRIRKPDQIIQPWMFGHPESKATCLWLKNLPLLKPTDIAEFKYYRCSCGNVFETQYGKYGCCPEKAAKPKWDNQTASGQNKLPPSKNRAKIRSKTYQGIADAMADQWGDFLIEKFLLT